MISKEVLALEPEVIAWRRHMHQNPELSFQEVKTTAYLTEELKKIPGLTLEFPTKTGVVAVLKGVQPGPAGLTEEPISVDGGKGKLFGQLPVGVKIQAQEK